MRSLDELSEKWTELSTAMVDEIKGWAKSLDMAKKKVGRYAKRHVPCASNLGSRPVPTTKQKTLQESNLALVQELVAAYQEGRPEEYMAGVDDSIKGSVFGGLIPGGDSFDDKEQFIALSESMDRYGRPH